MYVGIRGDASSALTALKQIQEEMKKSGQESQRTGSQVHKTTSQFNNIGNTIGKIHNPLIQLTSALSGVAAAFGLTKAAGLAWDLGMTTARVHEMDAVLRSLAANNAVAESAVWNGVAAIKSMGIETQVAQQTMAQFIRYQMDAARASDLARVAQDAAVLSGQNSSQALEGLIYGITTYNQRVIRTYGINVDMSNAFDALAGKVGKTVDELTEAEKVQAAMNAVLQEGTRITGAYAAAMEEPGKRWRSLPRYVNEIKVALGEAFLPVVGAAADGLTNISKAVLENADAFTAVLKPIGEAAAKVIEFVTALGTIAIQSTGAKLELKNINSEIVRMAGESVPAARGILGLADSWRALQDVGRIQQGIADKMRNTADAAAYMSRNVVGGFEEMRRLAEEYAEAQKEAERILDIGGPGAKARADKVRTDAMIKYNNAVWEYAKRNGVAASTLRDLIAAENEAAAAENELEAARWRGIQANQQAESSHRAAIPAIRAQTAAVRELAYAYYASQRSGPAATWRKNALAEFAEAREAARGSGGGGVDVGRQVAERQAQWERERVDNARRAALEIRYWEQDQQEWIADNAASLTPELQAEFAARTAAAKAEAERVKETDAALAQELLDSESEYQSEKAAIASDEGLTEEERAAKMAVLERENAERVERARETAALEAQIREEERQREIQQMREAGAAGGQAFAEEIEKAFDKLKTAEDGRIERMTKAKEEAKKGYGEIFDKAIERGLELLGIGERIAGAAYGAGAGPEGSRGGDVIPGGRAGYAEGGVVPGPIGAPQIAIVHGGESIVPPNRSGSPGAGVTVTVTGPVYASTAEQAQRAGEDIGRGIRMAAKAGGVTL